MIVWLLVAAITLLSINVLGHGERLIGGETVVAKKADRLPLAAKTKPRRPSDVRYIEYPATTILRIPVYGTPSK